MPRLLFLRVLFVVIFSIHCARAGGGPAGVVEPGMTEAWRLLASGDASAARMEFERLENREARVGLGVALLAVQPRTAAGLERARRLFEDVAAEPSKDDWTVLATYLLARWHQLHAIAPDAAEGERRLLALLEEHAGHPWADVAAPKLAIAWLNAGVDDAEHGRREERLRGLLGRLKDPGAIRDARLAMADAALRRNANHRSALPHYLALLEEADALRPSLRARVLFQAAESSLALGLKEEARAGWLRFLSEFPNDYRAGEATRRAKEISAP
ncbi:MAG: hypothetical protein MUE42_02325 [Opitutaceae bacterium]|nr:hypothetical protein [Opitutaceae bacterium]